jgi:uncharacterized protein (DUF1810 family)
MHADTDIERFVTAQNKSFEGYHTALYELQTGRKQSHWIWYVFPKRRPEHYQGSQYTQYYGLGDDAEATRYLHHPILGTTVGRNHGSGLYPAHHQTYPP